MLRKRNDGFVTQEAIMARRVPLAGLAALPASSWLSHPAGMASPSRITASRRACVTPVALALVADGKWLLTANQRSGSISIVDAISSRLTREVDVGRRLAVWSPYRTATACSRLMREPAKLCCFPSMRPSSASSAAFAG